MARATCAVVAVALLLTVNNVAGQVLVDGEARPSSGLGLPPLPEVTPASDLTDILYADRYNPHPTEPPPPPGGGATPVQVTLPGSQTGTGFQEVFWYQLPSTYNPQGPPVPMVLAWHGFGGSAQTVQNQSTLDEECDTRGWIYCSVTGLDDQLFGSPPSQQNADAALDWVMANLNVDEDRIYMVGFSMGAGVTSNFAARHRNPEGHMIAAIGLLAGAWDFTQTYNTSGAGTQSLLENPFNFGGPPTLQPFNYKAASTLYFDTATYPPLPGTLLADESMAINLATIPAHITWDPLDLTTLVQEHNPAMVSHLQSLGGTVVSNITLTPGGAHHSWDTLDEADLFDFFDGKSVTRYPADYTARLAESGKVSYTDLEVRGVDDFANIVASADSGAGTVSLTGVDNTKTITLHMDDAGLNAHASPRITATSVDPDGFQLRLIGFDTRPSYLVDAVSGDHITGVDSEPLQNMLIVDVPGNSTLDVTVIFDPLWVTTLYSDPNPSQLGGFVQLEIDAPADGNNILAFTILSAGEELLDFYGVTKLAADVNPPALIFPLLLDGFGDATVLGTIPNDSNFIGVRIVMQTAVFKSTGGLATMSNLWGLRVE